MRRYTKFAATVCWFVVFLGVFAASLWYMPDSWRVHPRLKKPVILVAERHGSGLRAFYGGGIYVPRQFKQNVDLSVILVGDSQAGMADLPHPRLTVFGADLPRLVKAIRKANFSAECKKIVIFYGTGLYVHGCTPEEIAVSINAIKDAVREKCPDKIIEVMPYMAILDVAKEHSVGDQAHPNKEGWAILVEQHPHILSSVM
jgi:hypothetical protein